MEEPVGAELVSRLFDSHARALMLYARQLCTDPEDAVQEAFLKLSEQRSAPREPLPWLFRVVRNEALMASRSNRRRTQRESRAAETKEAWFRNSSPESSDQAAVAAAVARLPLDQREIVTAHLWGGLTFREIGDLMGTSDSSAHRGYQQALERLRRELDGSEKEQS